MSCNLYDIAQARSTSQPTAPFLLLPDGRQLTYGELEAQTAKLANLFVSMGVAKGDRIALQVDKSAEALLVYLATLRAGAVHLPLNPAYTSAELVYFLADAAPVLLICKPAVEGEARRLCHEAGVPRMATLGVDGDGSLLDGLEAQSDTFATVPVDSDDLAAILYTSGTTGRSKGAMLTHGNLSSNAETLRTLWRFTASDRLLHALPIFHTHGLFVACNITLLAGGAMIFLKALDVDQLVALMPEATVLMGVPTFYTRLLDHPGFTRETVQDMRLFVSGSAPLPAETHKAFTARTGHAILERYGMTETNMITSNPYEGERVPGSVGLPLPGVEVRITDPAIGNPIEGVGMIEVRGPNVFKGYWRQPEKTAEEKRPDGFFITGDLGAFDARGYLSISGRAKDLIISGGYNVYPAEVEGRIDEIPGVAECAVIGVPHRDLGEAVVAVISCKATAALEPQAVRAALAQVLASYKRPKRVFVTGPLPRNAMGKVQKVELRRRYADTFLSAD